MPKCASTALEAALSERMDLVISGHPGAKHTNYRKYNRHLKKYLEGFSGGPLETVCTFREPVSWLHSWWRYRSRPDLPDPSRSTREVDFERFVELYIDDARAPANLGRQSRFISTIDGAIGIDRLFRYDRLDLMCSYLAGKLDCDVVLDRRNVSPAAHASDELSAGAQARLKEHLSRDFEIYESLS
ncbi:MAG: gamma-glutamyl kinase [Pseudomonadota bacterium]